MELTATVGMLVCFFVVGLFIGLVVLLSEDSRETHTLPKPRPPPKTYTVDELTNTVIEGIDRQLTEATKNHVDNDLFD